MTIPSRHVPGSPQTGGAPQAGAASQPAAPIPTTSITAAL